MEKLSKQHPLNVLVLAVGGNVSEGILKALATSSLPCRVIGTDLDALQMGLYTVDRGYIAPHATAPGFLDWLISLCNKEEVDIILSGCEPVLRILAPARKQIESSTRALCFVCPPEVWATCDDKLLTCEWLSENGFTCPAHAASEDHAGLHHLAETHGFPLIAKPRIGGGAYGILMIQSADDLEYVSRKKAYIIEEFLGTDDQEYTAGCFCDRNGMVCGSIVMWRELLAGTTYRAVAGEYPEVKREAERIAGALRCPGPCNIQLRMTERGPVCFEINPRFSGTTPIRAALGYNEVESVLRHFLLHESPLVLPNITRGIALRYWNELYVSPELCEATKRKGTISAVSDNDVRIEPYGM
ncbi:MAG: ATP-grasp domain-containing protein [Candidatus Hydrogenedentes bacterium]|nr:ATP-grasp domain-containing protein [Candidatus Hydrogenedentota bacterium]